MSYLPQQTKAVDVWHEVPLVPQLTGMSCWAAAAAMLVGWRDSVFTEPEGIAKATGHWRAYQDGLEPSSIEELAHKWRLSPLENHVLNPASLARIIRDCGPLWLGEASPGLHSIVIVGIYGDLTPQGTFLRVNDPWPIEKGERYAKSVFDVARHVQTASNYVGRHLQVLHSGGRVKNSC